MGINGIASVVQHCGNWVHPGLAQGLASLEIPLFISDSAQTTVASKLVFIYMVNTWVTYDYITQYDNIVGIPQNKIASNYVCLPQGQIQGVHREQVHPHDQDTLIEQSLIKQSKCIRHSLISHAWWYFSLGLIAFGFIPFFKAYIKFYHLSQQYGLYTCTNAENCGLPVRGLF